MILVPKELPDLRRRLADFMDSRKGSYLISASLTAKDATPRAKLAEIPEEHRTWAACAATALGQAELFHIQPSMVDLLLHAQEGLSDAGFMDHDLPAPHGFAYLAAPAPATYRGIEWGELLAVAWSYQPPGRDIDEYPHGRVVMSWYIDRDCWSTVMDIWQDGDRDSDKTRAETLLVLPPMVWDGHVTIACHPESAGVVATRIDMHSDVDGSHRERRPGMFRALCYLLRQRVAEETVAQVDRAARRRMAREGKEPPPVRVISIRGASAHGGGDGSREYVHRWIVRGHWRRQWYSSIQGHRPIWITPYVKGPEDAPLLGGEKVYTARAPSS